jgi:hypothetical protein
MVLKEVPLGSSIRYVRRVEDVVSAIDKRSGTRIECDYKCLLLHDDIVYPCQMKNISISGTLVYPLEVFPVYIQSGDTCDLLFRTHHTMFHLDYKSKVTRLEELYIALNFLDPTI